MSRPELSGPDLDGVAADGFLRATKDSDLLVPDRPQGHRDLEELEAFNGELPIDPIPGLDIEA